MWDPSFLTRDQTHVLCIGRQSINLWIIREVLLSKSLSFFLLLLLRSHFSHVPTLCDPIDGSPPGSPDPGILQARTLEWGAIAFSDLSS